MRIEGTNVVAGGGYGGDAKLPPPRQIREKRPAPPSPTRLRFPSDIPADKVRSYSSRKGVPLGPRPDSWTSPLAMDSKKVEQMVEMYEEGCSAGDIAKELECSKPTVLKYLRKNGVEVRPKGLNGAYRQLTSKDIADIRLRYEYGQSLRHIAKVYMISASTVQKYL